VCLAVNYLQSYGNRLKRISTVTVQNSKVLYIRRDKPSAASFQKHFETILRRLENFSESGRTIPEFPELPYLEVIISPYRFFYKDNIIWIVAVWHGAQLPKEPSH
jgi:plasmid stabilization system protein ParE